MADQWDPEIFGDLDTASKQPTSQMGRAFEALIEGDYEAFKAIADKLTEKRGTVGGVNRPRIVYGTATDPASDELYLGIECAGGTPSEREPWIAKLYYSNKKAGNNAAANVRIEKSIEAEVNTVLNAFLDWKNWDKYLKELGIRKRPDRMKLYKKFLMRLWKCKFPNEQLPLPKPKNDNKPGRGSAKKTEDDSSQQGTTAGQEDADPDAVSVENVLKEWNSASASDLWQEVNKRPGVYLKYINSNKAFFTAVQEGIVDHYWPGSDLAQIERKELIKCANAATQVGIQVVETDYFKAYRAKVASNTPGNINVRHFPSMEQIRATRPDYLKFGARRRAAEARGDDAENDEDGDGDARMNDDEEDDEAGESSFNPGDVMSDEE